MDAARIHRVLATNVVGSFICAREAVRRLSTRQGGAGGAIVKVSSGASRLGSPGEYVDYGGQGAPGNAAEAPAEIVESYDAVEFEPPIGEIIE